jgi:hypothetical protein
VTTVPCSNDAESVDSPTASIPVGVEVTPHPPVSAEPFGYFLFTVSVRAGGVSTSVLPL